MGGKGRPFVPVPARALDPREHDLAANALKALCLLANENQGAGSIIDRNEMEMGRLIADAIDGRWTKALTGLNTANWILRNLRDRNGDPMTEDTYKTLVRDYRAIHLYPGVEAQLKSEEGRRQFSRTGCYWACKRATLLRLQQTYVEDYIKGHGTEGLKQAAEFGEKKVHDWIFNELRNKSSVQLMEDFKNDARDMGAMEPGVQEFERFDKPIERSVFDRFQAALWKASRLAGDEHVDTRKLSPTQQIERVTQIAEDFFGIAEDTLGGNPKTFMAFVETYRRKIKKEGV